jgi:hypothetical protein
MANNVIQHFNLSTHGLFGTSYEQTEDGTITSVSIEADGEELLNLPMNRTTVDDLIDLRKAAMDLLQHLHLRTVAESAGYTTDAAEQQAFRDGEAHGQAREG